MNFLKLRYGMGNIINNKVQEIVNEVLTSA